MFIADSQAASAIIGVLVIIMYIVIPIWAVVSVLRNLRGVFRVFWVVGIIAGALFIPLIGLMLSLMYFAFKRRFIAAQRTRRVVAPNPWRSQKGPHSSNSETEDPKSLN